jgi:hypothetical protein
VVRHVDVMRSGVAVALEAELSAVIGLLGNVDDAGFEVLTNCPPWTLKELSAHIVDTTRLPTEWRAGTGPPRPAADWYRRPERSTAEYRQFNVLRVQDDAAHYRSGGEVVRQLRVTRDEVVERLDGEDLHRVVELPLGAMTIEGFVATRVLAGAAHALDVAITLDVPQEPSDAALAVCTPILVELLGAVPPDALGWSAADFFRRGTGRMSLSEADIAGLGHLAERFPLVS